MYRYISIYKAEWEEGSKEGGRETTGSGRSRCLPSSGVLPPAALCPCLDPAHPDGRAGLPKETIISARKGPLINSRKTTMDRMPFRSAAGTRSTQRRARVYISYDIGVLRESPRYKVNRGNRDNDANATTILLSSHYLIEITSFEILRTISGVLFKSYECWENRRIVIILMNILDIFRKNISFSRF